MSPYRSLAERPDYTPDLDTVLRRPRMSLLYPVTALVAIGLGASTGCALFTAKNAETVLDVAKVICIVANAESGDATVKTICNIADAEDAAFHAVLNEHRMQARRYAAMRCAPDNGPNASTGDAGVEAGKK